MKKFPVLISVPHGGDEIPAEVKNRLCLSQQDLFADGDAFTREIYGIVDSVTAYIDTPYARAFIDLNRDTHDLPPKNPDGIVKTTTCHGKTIYSPGKELSLKDSLRLIENYYHPYHQNIRQLLDTHPDIQLALDCHSMEAIGPAISPDRGQKRPAICLGTNKGKSCPMEMAEKLATCFQTAFGLDATEIVIDQPFSGGFITRTYGNQPIPWIQIEISRALYLSEPWFDKDNLSIQKSRLRLLRGQFQEALKCFMNFGK
ncbi:MAG: N-formylglutamate amidohydrolase [Nitrosomonas sp.]|nr:N-formylglutamate amidohydrolase [Nitrosomonas sp.]